MHISAKIILVLEGGDEIYLLYPAAGMGAALGGGLGILGGIASSCFGIVLLIAGSIVALTVKPRREADSIRPAGN